MSDRKIRPKDVPEITSDDFYRRNAEFKSFLIDHKRHFDELSSDKARHHFAKFVSRWNEGRLKDSVYYLRQRGNAKADNRSQPDVAYTCSFDWKKKRQAKGLERVLDEQVATETPVAQSFRERSKEDKRFARRVKQDAEDLVPKPEPGSHQARVEKRRLTQNSGHGDECLVEYNDSTLMGGGDDYAAHKRRKGLKDNHKADRRRAASDRIVELEAKERERMETFKARLGL